MNVLEENNKSQRSYPTFPVRYYITSSSTPVCVCVCVCVSSRRENTLPLCLHLGLEQSVFAPADVFVPSECVITQTLCQFLLTPCFIHFILSLESLFLQLVFVSVFKSDRFRINQ